MHESLPKKNGDPKKPLGPKAFSIKFPFTKCSNSQLLKIASPPPKLWGCDKTKGHGLKAVNCGTVRRKHTGEGNDREGLC